MFQLPMMNRRQQQALVQSALQKINVYQQKQIAKQLEQPKIDAEVKTAPSIKKRPELRSQLRRTFVAQPILIEDEVHVVQKDVIPVAQEDEIPVVQEDETPVVQEDEIAVVEETVVFTIGEDSDKEKETETELSEVKQELTEAMKEQAQIESNLIAENKELQEQFVAEFTEDEQKEEMTLQVVDEE
jgi:hypothetical protein